MKITVYYEDRYHPAVLDVPDEECEVWIENDYQKRLSEAEDKSGVKRRTAQEIMDEDFNRPTFNTYQRDSRHCVSLEALYPEGKYIHDGSDMLGDLIDREEYEELYAAISTLSPEQKELLKKVYWDHVTQTAIAEADGVNRPAISLRLKRIYNRLQKFLENRP